MSMLDDLKRVPLFSELDDGELRRLGRQLGERSYEPGMPVVEEGKAGGVSFFIIADGEATVTVGGKEVASLGPGDHFGELALISDRERNATVTAATPLRCLAMPFWNFRAFALENADVTWKLLQHVIDMLVVDRS